jgi:hypothetical protein
MAPVHILTILLTDWKDGFLWFWIAEFKRAERLLWLQKKIRDSSNGLSLKERKG